MRGAWRQPWSVGLGGMRRAAEPGTFLAISRLCEGDPLRDDLRQIRDAGDRAARLTRQLLAFSRRQVLEPEARDHIFEPFFTTKDLNGGPG